MTKTLDKQQCEDAVVKLRDEIASVETLRSKRQHEVAGAERKLATLKQRISAIEVAASQLHDSDAQAQLRSEQVWFAQLTEWRKLLIDELSALPNLIRDAHMLGVQENLTISFRIIEGIGGVSGSGYELTSLRLGELMRVAGYEPEGADPDRNNSGVLPWLGSIPEIEMRIKQHAERHATAQAMLDDALMGDDERAKRDAESKARRDALNALPTRKERADGSQYDRYPDGRVVEVTLSSDASTG